MSILKNSGRQEIIAAIQEINLADFDDGAAQAAIELPQGAIIVGGILVTDVVFNAETTATLSVGTVIDGDAYLAATDVKTLGVTPLVPTGTKTIAPINLFVTYASTGAVATTGTARLIVEYIRDGRALFSQG